VTAAVVFVIVIVLLIFIVFVALVMVFRGLGTDWSVRTLRAPTVAVLVPRAAGGRRRSDREEEGNDTYQQGKTT